MPKYRKRPVVVEAHQLTLENQLKLYDWIGIKNRKTLWEDGEIDIFTLEGTMRANVGDWIIRGVQGEFYPCKPEIFEATYELLGVQ